MLQKKYFLILIVFIVLNPCTSYTSNTKNEQSQQETMVFDDSDIQLFYNVIDTAKSEEKKITGQYMYEEYVQKSSAGLKNGYAVARGDVFPVNEDGSIDYSVYDKKVKTLLPFYEKNRNSILNRTLLSKKQKQNIEQKLCDFLETNLCAQLLDNTGIYISVSGGLNMGGTAFPQGVFIDASMVYNESIDYSLLPEAERRFSKTFSKKDNISFLIAHEFIHTFQLRLNEHFYETIDFNLQTIALLEGGASYFATKLLEKELVSRRVLRQEDYMKNNKEKYIEFLEDIKKSKTSQDDEERKAISIKWFFNGASKEVAQGLYPEDVGYYIGSKIFETFYEDTIKTQDKDEVIKQLLLLEIPEKDIETILETLATGM